jgi:branched-chain amino acid transport system substrate-binding protein
MGIRNATILATEEWAGRLADVGVRVAADAADDEARPATGVANATRLVRDSSVIAIIGHLNSGVAIPSSEIYAQGGLAMVSPANTNPMVTERGLGNVFRVIGRDDVQGTAMATFARDGLRLRHVAIAHDSTSYGTGTASTFAAQAPIVGISILEAGHFGAAVPAIVSAQPDGVFFGGIYDDAARFLLDLSRSGYRGRFLGTDGLDSAEFARLAGSQVVGVHYATVAGPITAYPEATQLARRYEQRFRVPAEPFVAEAYDATSIVLSVIHAIARAQGGHTISRSAVVDGLKQIQAFPGATGPISFSRKGDRNPAQYFVVRVNSSNPSAWDRNQLVQRYRISPPP